VGQRLTALDAAFLHFEHTGQPLHVGGVYPVEGALDFTRLLTDVAGRLHLIPRYTQRVVPVPLHLAHPTWEPDPHFSIQRHVLRHRLRPPGDDEQLASLAGRLFAQPLERERPLWELHQIDGYRGDRSALFAKVHHCMIDGVSGVQLLAVVFDPSPRPAPVPAPAGGPEALPLPSAADQLLVALRDGLATARERAAALAALLRRPRRALEELGYCRDAVVEALRFVAAGRPATPFNGHVSILRRVLWESFSLNEVKAVRSRLGGTVNDVVLTAISAALRRYLEGHDIVPDRLELRAVLPVNVRGASEHLALGNRVSFMLGPLPVGIYDARERYRQVRAATAQLKARGQAGHMTRVLELFALLPPPLQRAAGWLPTGAMPVNTICTNVPGPGVSLYVQGQRLERLVPLVPLVQGVGLAVAILSYADTITVGLTTDPALVPDGERLCAWLRGGMEELYRLAGVEPPPRRLRAVGPERQRRRESAARG
jgi:WS/DGAT/MGAT family acyltransferase